MSMQDNEIDEIFRSKLGDFEVQPTERVWKGITTELDGAKAKRTLVPVFRIAAAIALFLSAGLYFLLKDEPTQDAAQTAQEVNGKHHAPAITLNSKTDGETAPGVAEGQPAVTEAPAIAAVPKGVTSTPGQKNNTGNTEHTISSQTGEPTVAEPKATIDNNPVTTHDEQPQLIVASGNVKPVSQAVVPDQPLVTKAADNEQDNSITPAKTNPVTAPVMANAGEAKPARKRHGIHSLGDLINVVVAKVDKREDKVIEFSNTDDDESTITGINLGLVKVKKDK